MGNIASPDVPGEILERVKRLEAEVRSGFSAVDNRLVIANNAFDVFRDGLQAYRDRILREARVTHRERHLANWREQVRSDRELRSPHRKIIDVLSGQFDFAAEEFGELQFSKLVKAARIGKNRAQAYLCLLEGKGYITSRFDGYRKFYRVNISGPESRGAMGRADFEARTDREELRHRIPVTGALQGMHSGSH